MSKMPAQGLLLGDRVCEAVGLEAAAAGYKVAAYSWLELPVGLVVGGRVIDKQGVAAKVKQLLSQAKPKAMTGAVVLGLPQAQVFWKVFSVPKFEGKDLQEAISWHVGSLAPVIPEDTYTAWEVEDLDGEMRVVLAAANKQVVDEYVEAVNLAGVEVAVIEPVVMAKTRLINPRQLVGKSVVSLHLYGGILTASILVNGKVWFSREVTDGTGVTVQALVAEMVDYFNKGKDKHAADLSGIIYGGGSEAMGSLKANLGGMKLPVEVAEAGIGLQASTAVKDVATAVFAPVVGLALRGRVDDKALMNLLPEWVGEVEKNAQLKRATRTWLLLVGVGLWLLVMGLVGWRWWLVRETGRVETALANIAVDQKQETEAFGFRDEFNGVVKRAGALLKTQVDYGRVLRDLGRITPQRVRVTAVVYKSPGTDWSIAGVAERREDVLVFDRELEQAEVFKGAQLYLSSLESEEEVTFRFTGGGK